MYLGIILAALLAIVLIEIAFGRFMQKEHTKLRDVFIEIFSTANVFFLTVPLTVAAAASLAAFLLPDHAGALSHLPAWAMFLMLMVGEDMLQYWWHRANHKFPILYNLHRVHHDADYLNIRITFRNNLFYYLPMPSIWSSAVLVYLGLGPVYAVYIVAKYLVIMGAHSSVHWDEPLYKIKWLSPVMWVVERTISTPATHSAHHGRHKEDGVTNYKGNFGNFFFLWDVIFGTAKITRKFPKEYGVENLNDISGAQLMFWPLVGASNGSKETVVKPAE
jgi:sterol desaturase/sphingolipid hydroxylase (fatty acid hydroxylase superfamily)